MEFTPIVDKSVRSRFLLDTIISYHKYRHLDGNMPRYLDGIHLDLEYTATIRTIEESMHSFFMLYRMYLSGIQQEVRGYICMVAGELMFYKQIIYLSEKKYKLLAYRVTGVHFEHRS